MLFAHQQRAYQSLLETAEIFYSGNWRSLPVRPRFSRLVVGPSGVGKSHLVRCVAEQFELPVLALDAPNWIPLGANEKGVRQTWVDILGFLRNHAHGMIFVDEIDKAARSGGVANCPWLHFVRVEIFSLLDRRIPENLLTATSETVETSESSLLRRRLKEGIMLLGAGAFQDLWENRTRAKVGFKTDNPKESEPALDQRSISDFLATEIVNRFEAPVLTLSPLRFDDYREILDDLVSKLPSALARDVAQIGALHMAEAVHSQLGVRWLEEVVYRALAKQRISKTKRRKCTQKEARKLLELAEI